MSDWKLPWSARCRCGRVEMTISAPPLITMACHCTGCQRMTASAYSLSVAVPAEGFEVTRGEPVLGGLQGADRHHHCPHCKSWLFTRPDGLDFMVNVRASMLDDASWFEPYVETSRAEGFPWAATGTKHSFAGQPSQEEFAPLLAEFARQGARPR